MKNTGMMMRPKRDQLPETQYPEVLKEEVVPRATSPALVPRKTKLATVSEITFGFGLGFLKLLFDLAIPQKKPLIHAAPLRITTSFQELRRAVSELNDQRADSQYFRDLQEAANHLIHRRQQIGQESHSIRSLITSNARTGLNIHDLHDDLDLLLETLHEYIEFLTLWNQRLPHLREIQGKHQILRDTFWDQASNFQNIFKPGHRYNFNGCTLDGTTFGRQNLSFSKWTNCNWFFLDLTIDPADSLHQLAVPEWEQIGQQARALRLERTVQRSQNSQSSQRSLPSSKTLRKLIIKARNLLAQQAHGKYFLLRGSQFIGCNFFNVTLKSAPGHTVKKITFSECTWENVTLGLIAEGWVFQQGQILDTDLQKCQIIASRFVDLKWEGGIVEDTIFVRCIFERNEFKNVHFKDVEFRHCQFAERNSLVGCTFSSFLTWTGHTVNTVLAAPIFSPGLRLCGIISGITIRDCTSLRNVFCEAEIEWLKLEYTDPVFANGVNIRQLIATKRLIIVGGSNTNQTESGETVLPECLEQIERKAEILKYIEQKIQDIKTDSDLDDQARLRQCAYFQKWLEDALEHQEDEPDEQWLSQEYDDPFGPAFGKE